MEALQVVARRSSRRGVHHRPVLAAAPRGSYQSDVGPNDRSGVEQAPGGQAQDPVAGVPAAQDGASDVDLAATGRVLASVEALGELDLAALDDRQLDAYLARLRRPLAALEAARSRALAEVERRARTTQGPERGSAAVLETRRRVAKDQRMTPSEAKRSAEAGTHAAANPETGDAFDAGDIGPSHVRLIGDALRKLPAGRREEAERVLLELARTSDPIAFGRQVRQYLATHAPEELHRQEHGKHRERRFRMTDTDDGGVAFSGLAYGTAAELARTALGAFRRPDTPDEHRTPEQRSADAFEQLCDAALRLGDAPTIHGERPHIMLIVEESELTREVGTARFAGSGQPITLTEAGTLLTDCVISRLVRAADGTPIEVTENVRTVPAGLWRALVVRDAGCRWPGCDAPAAWCDVAHGEDPYRAEGKLSPANAVLLCRRHHRRFDKGPWRVDIDGEKVTFHRIEQPYVHPLDRAAAQPRPTTGRTPPSGTAATRPHPPPNDLDTHAGPPPPPTAASDQAPHTEQLRLDDP